MTRLLWLDLTRNCQLKCTHCYNSSGPDGTHGTMTQEDWIRALDQAVSCNVRNVQFIGGEPTMHPAFADLVDHALNVGLSVEVYSNLVHVSAQCWELFQRKGLSLATSYYSDRAEEHNAMTGRPSHRRTRANIERAVGLGIPVRVGIIDSGESQRVTEARHELEGMGVARIGIDHIRPFGRGAQTQAPHPAGLCGRCGVGRAAIGPTGEVSPCVFAAWMGVGNVKRASLADILSGAAMAQAKEIIRSAGRMGDALTDKCYPDATPCYPAETPCTPQGHLPEACCPEDEECNPGTPPSTCNPRR